MHTHGGQLSFEKAEAIRHAYARGGCSQAALAIDYGVSQVMVSKVVRGELWATPHVSTCARCGVAFARKGPVHLYCASCKAEMAKVWDHTKYRKRRPAVEGRMCPHCGSALPAEKRADAVFCSEVCNSAAHQLKRGNGRLSRGSGRRREIARAYIVERDQSRCHLCGKTCRPEEIHLDHLVPVSAGGDHSPANLRVACAACNLSKRAAARNEQLLLVG